MTRAAIRLISTNPSPAVGPMPLPAPATKRKRKPTPLISTKARETEAKGKPFYETVRLNPKDLPSAYLALTAYRPRVERRFWRVPVASAIGAVVGIAALGLSGHLLTSCAVGITAGFAVWISDGWMRS